VKQALLLAGLALVCGFLLGCEHSGSRGRRVERRPCVVFPDGWVVQVDLAITDDERARGLMFVKDLPPERGKLFLFERAEVRPFWMKNCSIPLDMIWLDASNRIVDITKQAPPCAEDPCPNYYPSAPALNVLEVAGGQADAHRLAAGDVLVFVDVPPLQPGG
jgi:hypothetical protein